MGEGEAFQIMKGICKRPRTKSISSLFKEQWRSLSVNGVKVIDGFEQRSGLTLIAILSVDREGRWKAKEGVETG